MRTIFLQIMKNVICNLSLEKKDRFLFPIYRKQETKVTFVNRSELIARPFVPSVQFSSFVPFCHSRGTSFVPSFFHQFSPCAGCLLSLVQDFASSRSPPQTLPCLYCFLRPQARYSLRSRKKRQFFSGNAMSTLLRFTRTILPVWSSNILNFIIYVFYNFLELERTL